MEDRERKYLDMIAECPESPLGHFTLGRYYVEVGRAGEAVAPLERCLAEDPEWTAAMVALLHRAERTPQARHGGLADDIAERLEDLSD